MLKNILDEKFVDVLDKKIGLDKIYEIRMRAGLPTVAICGGQAYFVGPEGLTFNKNVAIKFSKQMLEDIIYRASEFSIYSIAQELKHGFIVLDDGVRIGVAGDVVRENETVKTITNFSSLNIRIPHIVRGVCAPFMDLLTTQNEVHNTLIISPPGQGKTTFLRDFAYTLSSGNYFFNILVIDERGEIAGKNVQQTVGDMCDVLAFCTKKLGILQGIRAMNPDIILTDELGPDEDFEAIKGAANSGVKVLATIHAKNTQDLANKANFEAIKEVFSRYVVLNPFGKAGDVVQIFGQNFELLFQKEEL